jgi:hypothetical protein
VSGAQIAPDSVVKLNYGGVSITKKRRKITPKPAGE